MFQSARLKLTAWYLLIIMCVSVLFSLVIYTLINEDYSRIEQMQRVRMEREDRLRPYLEQYRLQLEKQGLPVPQMPPEVDLDPINQARIRLKAILILINLTILGVAGLAGYFLAGRTLRPIKEMVEEQNRFITDASHELRTPLTSLKSEIEVNLRNTKFTLKESKGLLESNLEEVNKLQYLSDNLIKLTQYQKINGQVAFEQVFLIQVLEEAVKKVSKLAARKKIEIKNQTENLTIKGDKQNLVELFVIFLDNAIKYSSKDSTISLNSIKKEQTIIVEVKDQGMGIAKKDIPHLFDRFYRADKSRSQSEGYGLGLAIAKQIVDKHHGSIRVDSEIGNGTTFIIQLPIKR